MDSASFTAPGCTATASDLSGDFHFTYDQSDVLYSNNVIRLESSLGGSTSVTDCAVTRSAKITGTETETTHVRVPVQGVGLVLVAIEHIICESFACISYSAPVVAGSKTIRVGLGEVNIKTPVIQGVPTEIAKVAGVVKWTEKHLYRRTDGDHLEQPMSSVTYVTLPAQGPHFRSKDCASDAFLEAGPLEGIGKFVSVAFDSPAGLVIPFPSVLPPANKEVDVPMECSD